MNRKLPLILKALLLAFAASSQAWYDPSTATFLSIDPIRENGGVALYGYCNNQPIGNYDPIGLSSFGWTDEDERELQLLRQKSRANTAENHPWLARLFGLGRGITAPIMEPLGGAGADRQMAALTAPFVAASTVTMGTPEEIQAIGSGIANMAQSPYGQGELAGNLALLLTGPKLVGLPFRTPGGSSMAGVAASGRISYAPGELMLNGQLAGVGPGAMFVGEKLGTDYVVSFMGKNAPLYYNKATATLGRNGGTVWAAPLDDVANIANRAGVVTGTGHAPSPLISYLKGEPIYGLSIPSEGLPLRLPAALDGGANIHFRVGGFTGVQHNGIWRSSGVREFVMPGGSPMPSGSVLFEFNPNGSWTPIRRW